MILSQIKNKKLMKEKRCFNTPKRKKWVILDISWNISKTVRLKPKLAIIVFVALIVSFNFEQEIIFLRSKKKKLSKKNVFSHFLKV